MRHLPLGLAASFVLVVPVAPVIRGPEPEPEPEPCTAAIANVVAGLP